MGERSVSPISVMTRCIAGCLVPMMLAACVSRRTVHWSDDLPGVAKLVEELTEDRTAAVTLSTGNTFEAERLVFRADSLSLMPSNSSNLRTLALTEVEEISVTGRATKRTAVALGLTGVSLGILAAILCHRDGGCAGGGILNFLGVPTFGGVGFIGGAIIGSLFEYGTTFVP